MDLSKICITVSEDCSCEQYIGQPDGSLMRNPKYCPKCKDTGTCTRKITLAELKALLSEG